MIDAEAAGGPKDLTRAGYRQKYADIVQFMPVPYSNRFA